MGHDATSDVVRRQYLNPKISTILQELEGFTYATGLDLNMGYYTNQLDPKAVEMFIHVSSRQ